VLRCNDACRRVVRNATHLVHRSMPSLGPLPFDGVVSTLNRGHCEPKRTNNAGYG
jgi:hypothetical protein